jgi:uncharacterized protein involved in exopolysaccharide biosynthesis
VTAEQVASELIQRILNEDVRDRTERASNTTKFMTEEVKKLQAENAMLDAKVSELRASLRVAGPAESGSSESAGQLSELRNEYAQKSALYSEQHPVLKLLRRQIQALESTKSAIKSTDAEGVATLDALVAKQEAARKTLDQANAKLTSAQAGENLERNQQSEKLDVIERPTVPQRALKPNRLKLALTAMVAALGSGIVLAYLVEALDTRIRSSGDLVSIIDRQLIVPIPFISNRADMRRKTAMLVFLMLGLLAGATAASYSAQPLIPHFNDLVTKTRAGFTN